MFSDGKGRALAAPVDSLLRDKLCLILYHALMKQCSACLGLLPLDRFGPRKGSPDGLLGHCKSCIGKKNARWKKENPVAYLCSMMLAQAKRRAQSTGREFNLTIKDMLSLVVSRCPVLGTDLVWEYGHGRGLDNHSPSLDRIDNSLGYVKGNVAIISHRANAMKNSSTVKELRLILAYVENPVKLCNRNNQAQRKHYRMSDEDRLMILKLYNQGHPGRKIAQLVGASKSSVYAYLKSVKENDV
jgi:hypothetical protein